MRMTVGVDPHKRSVTLEVVDEDGKVAATGRFGTGSQDYRAMLGYVRRQWPHQLSQFQPQLLRRWRRQHCQHLLRPPKHPPLPQLRSLPRQPRQPRPWQFPR